MNNSPFDYDTSKKRLENMTSEYILGFPKGYYKDFASHIAQVKIDEIKPALTEFFNLNDLTLTIVGDADSLKDEVKKIDGFSNMKIKNYLED
jgi:predicted Zn-dependent peptidase